MKNGHAIVTTAAILIVATIGICQEKKTIASSAEVANGILEATGVQGGLVVHLGCGDGILTAALHANDSYLVHGLDTDPANVAKAREHIRSLGLYGRVAIDHLTDACLPYIDNSVNLVVMQDTGCEIRDEEILRVLAPGGALLKISPDTRNPTPETSIRKPRPEQTDEWTHYLHGPDNNAVAHDSVVGSPFHVQWVGGPKWARHHNHLSSTSAMVTSGGRLFAIVDEGPTASINLPPKWFLVARDAYNGVVLWKKPVSSWEGHLRPFRSGPTELSRRLVAVGDRVYVTLGYGAPLTALDARTGRVARTYSDTEGTVEILLRDGVLYVVVGEIDEEQYAMSTRRGSPSPPARNKHIRAINAESGETIWTKSDEDTRELLPTTLCVSDDRVFFHGIGGVICLDSRSGKELWRVPRPTRTKRLGWSAPTLVVQDGVVLSADCTAPSTDGPSETTRAQIQWTPTARPKRGDDSLGELIALSADDGSELWRTTTAQGFNAPSDVFVANGLVWTSTVPNLTSMDFTEGRDLRTGEVKRQFDTAAAFTTTHHHRCYRNKATDRFIFLGRTGTELIDLQGEKPLRHCWLRGSCQYGVMPANGLLYAPPHSCACYIQSKLSGLWALAPAAREVSGFSVQVSGKRLDRGPAYGDVSPTPDTRHLTPDSWPTYRRDAARSGYTTSALGAKLHPAWECGLGSQLTSPVVADGKVLVASIDTHTVHAINAADGTPVWSRTVGGRVDSPPTIFQGLALFGSADGYVYCVRLTDGELVWRFLAAPQDRRTVAFGQVESVWPVTGSVLVHDGVVYCTAGRSSYLDGGMYLNRLDPVTGEQLGQSCFYSRDPETGEQPEALVDDVEMPGALPDVLACDGQNIFLRDKRLDTNGIELEPNVPHLYSSAGLLDDNWWHRTYWVYGTKVYGRASGWAVVGNYVPSGRLLVLDETSVYGFGRKRVGGGDRGLSDVALHLFRADQQVTPLTGKRQIKNNNLALTRHFKPTKVTYHWSCEVPLVIRAMVLAGDVLFAAGPPIVPGDGAVEPTFDDRSGALLMAFSAKDGQELSKYELDAQPTFDGMAVAGGRLFLSTTGGRVICMTGD
ncbi:MAG: PQQ-binding-like beta-propeller repeat protein [Planctomycetes bacterium]|nr:PQQ-binding-like beta-propeller repeat protein [Planctomycetota bacterium]